MAGAALFGFLTGSGLFFVALILLALQTLYLGTIEVLARIHFNYRQRHPRIASASVAHKVRNTRIFWLPPVPNVFQSTATVMLLSGAARPFARRRLVGQDGILLPIGNRPNAASLQHSSFAACRDAGQAGSPSVRLPRVGVMA